VRSGPAPIVDLDNKYFDCAGTVIAGPAEASAAINLTTSGGLRPAAAAINLCRLYLFSEARNKPDFATRNPIPGLFPKLEWPVHTPLFYCFGFQRYP
jgi:hypothetical protein